MWTSLSTRHRFRNVSAADGCVGMRIRIRAPSDRQTAAQSVRTRSAAQLRRHIAASVSRGRLRVAAQ